MNELAILAGLEACHSHQKVKIYTDSQCAIDICENITQDERIRSKLKKRNVLPRYGNGKDIRRF